jgi:LPXTG-motif cell wall-anchored protein
VLWNEAYLGWTEFGDEEGTPPHSLTSNDVTDTATASIPPLVSPPRPPEVLPPSLPNTGGPSLWSAVAGLVLVLGGSLLVLGDRRRRRRS